MLYNAVINNEGIKCMKNKYTKFILFMACLAILIGVSAPNIISKAAGESSGQCGDNLYWSYDANTCTLNISGSGKTPKSYYATTPWSQFQDDIKYVTLSNGACMDNICNLKLAKLISISGQCGQTAYWRIDITDNQSGDLTIYGKGATYNYKEIEEQPWWDSNMEYSINKVTVSEGITKLGNHTLHFIPTVKEISLPKSLKTVGKYSCGGFEITSLSVPQNVTTIGTYAFSGNNSLGSISIGKNVTKLGAYAFAFNGMEAGKVVIKINSKKIKNFGEGVFINLGKNTKIYLPKSKYNFYKEEINNVINNHINDATTDSQRKGRMSINKIKFKKL